MAVTKTATGASNRPKEPTPSPPVSSSSAPDLRQQQQQQELAASTDGKDASSKGPRWIQKVPLLASWKGRTRFLQAQGQSAGILLIAYLVNQWPVSYQRNENHNPTAFWIMVTFMIVVTLLTIKHEPAASHRGIPLLTRQQTEEWKGWMQWMFIMVRPAVCKFYSGHFNVVSWYLITAFFLCFLFRCGCCHIVAITQQPANRMLLSTITIG